MKKIFLLVVLISFLCTCSKYNYDSTYHSSDILFNSDEFAQAPELWDFYVHDLKGRTYKGRSSSMNDGAFSTVLVERFVEPIPVALKPDEEYRKNEVHVFVEDTLIEERVKSNFLPSDIIEVVSFVTPSSIRQHKKSNATTTTRTVLGTVGIVVGGVLGGILLIALIVTAIVNSFLSSIGCYIATMAYGSYDAPEVLVLRRFRDEKLKRSFLGRVFIANYYAFSPLLVQFVKKTGIADRLIRRKLDRFVNRLRTKNNW
jgi:hypothetical protein